MPPGNLRIAAVSAFVWFISFVVCALVVATFELNRILVMAIAVAGPFGFVGLYVRGALRFRRAEAALRSGAFRTRSGFLLVPGTGESSETAIVCLESDPSIIPVAELEYAFEQVLKGSEDAWQIVSQALSQHRGNFFDVLTLQNQRGQTRQVHYNISRSQLFSG